jgi:hypothetical protein
MVADATKIPDGLLRNLSIYGRFATKIPDALYGRAGHFYWASPQ